MDEGVERLRDIPDDDANEEGLRGTWPPGEVEPNASRLWYVGVWGFRGRRKVGFSTGGGEGEPTYCRFCPTNLGGLSRLMT